LKLEKVEKAAKFRLAYYAQALFDLARAENAVDQVEVELQQLKDEVIYNLDLKKYLSDPAVEKSDKIKAILEILGEDSSRSIQSFAAMMIILNAIDFFEQAYKDFVELANQLKRQVSIEVFSVIDLDSKLLDEIKKEVDKKTGLDVRIKNIIDKNILGGLVIKIGDRVIDLSIKNKIEDLRTKLKALDLRGEKFGIEN
jgi:F-type H+-transporting ATPase subunit delta